MFILSGKREWREGVCMVAERTNKRTQMMRLIMASSAQLPDSAAGVACRKIALDQARKLRSDIPNVETAYPSFETSDGQVRCETGLIDGIDTWSLRMSLPDPRIAGRVWTTEVTSLTGGDEALLSVRLNLLSDYGDFGFNWRVPKVLHACCTAFSLRQANVSFSPNLRLIGTDISVEGAASEILSPDRWWDVLICHAEMGRFDAQDLQAGLAGIANVYVLDVSYSAEFLSLIGDKVIFPEGFARLFRPGFEAEDESILQHPMLRLGEGVTEAVGRDAMTASVTRSDVRYKAPSFATIKQMVDKDRLEVARTGADIQERIKALEQMVKSEAQNTEEAIALALQAEEERQLVQEALAQEQATNYALRTRLRNLESQGETTRVASGDVPQTYADMVSWVKANLSDKLRLTSRAEKALRRARYDKVSDVLTGLQLLARPYRDMKRGAIAAQEFEHQCRAEGFEETRSVSKVSAGQHGDTYFVQHQGHRRFLDRHLKKGTAMDERHCLRIYFFWDPEAELVIVGSLPGHLSV